MNAHLSNLMNKEVSRGEFLGIVGLAVASVFGFGALLKLLTGKSLETHHVVSMRDYRASVYGGSER